MKIMKLYQERNLVLDLIANDHQIFIDENLSLKFL